MPKEEKNNQFIAIRSMFLGASVRKMKDIEKLYPTLVAKSLRINHSRYIQKLNHPEEFSIQQLIALSELIDLDVQLIWNVILKQLAPGAKPIRKK